jgi:hypothetical protein
MKKLLTLLVGLMLIMSIVTAAPPMPKPIRGYFTVNGQGISGTIIEVTNGRTGETISGDTLIQLVTETNGFAFDLADLTQGAIEKSEVYAGDLITVQARGWGEDGKITFNVPADTPYEITIAVTSGQTLYQCSDGTTVSNIANCPEEEDDANETKVVSSADGSTASVDANLGQTIDIELSDNKVDTLLDKEIKYDGEGYDIHEEVTFSGTALTSLDDEDYGLDPYINIAAGAIVYKYVFEDALPFADIHAEEPLEITLLGKEITIIEAADDTIVLRSGEAYFIKEGETEGGVLVEAIGENSVSVKVDGITQIITDGDSRDVGGLNVLVNEILYKSYEDSFVELIIGTEGDKEIKDGDDFELFIENDETYKWVIDIPNSIGVTNIEDYSSIDDDEEYKPIGVGEGIGLPNDYLVFGFKQVSEVDMIDLTFKVDDGYLNVRGPDDAFVLGSDEYDEVNVNSVGIYDEDEELISNEKVRIGDSDIYLEMGVKIGLLTIKLDMSDILYDGVSYAGKDTNFMDYVGLIFKDPENAVDDEKGFKVEVPEERPEVTLTIGTDVIIPPEDDDVVVPPEPPIIVPPVEPPVIPPVEPPVIPPVEPPVVPPVEPPVDEDDNTLATILITLIAAIIGLFAWGKGFAGLIKYYLKEADKAEKAGDKEKAKAYRARAEKMAKSVVTNYLAGKYKK